MTSDPESWRSHRCHACGKKSSRSRCRQCRKDKALMEERGETVGRAERRLIRQVKARRT